jgi:hypothetical protein
MLARHGATPQSILERGGAPTQPAGENGALPKLTPLAPAAPAPAPAPSGPQVPRSQ